MRRELTGQAATSNSNTDGLQVLQRCFDIDVQEGKNLVDAAASIADTTLERFVWSDHFDSKAVVKAYIQSAHPEVAKKTVYLQMSSYMTNWKISSIYLPIKVRHFR